MASKKITYPVVVLGGALLVAASANAQPVATASSPDGAVSVAVTMATGVQPMRLRAKARRYLRHRSSVSY